MAVSKDKAMVSNKPATVTAKITGVYESDKVEERGGYTFEYPFRIRIEDGEGNILSDEETSSTLNTMNWSKKFYEKDRYINYTRYETLLAIMTILRAKPELDKQKLVESDEFDINKIVGYEFEVVTGDNGTFINWYRTLQYHGIEVPQANESKEVETISDTNDTLPF